MLAVIGLGNPGSEYANTRHNVGFRVIDAVAEKLRIRLKSGKGDYFIGEKDLAQNKAILVKPLTYMNNSGLAVLDIVQRFSLQTNELLVVCDDFNIPFGTLRLRMNGSDGGHNGLYSIIYHLGSMEFPRLRCGIGHENKKGQDLADFVLSPFDEAEKPDLRKMEAFARDIVISAAAEGYQGALERLNKQQV
jgi:PTH1 family peptidyl-tRNA hydrolase